MMKLPGLVVGARVGFPGPNVDHSIRSGSLSGQTRWSLPKVQELPLLLHAAPGPFPPVQSIPHPVGMGVQSSHLVQLFPCFGQSSDPDTGLELRDQDFLSADSSDEKGS